MDLLFGDMVHILFFTLYAVYRGMQEGWTVWVDELGGNILRIDAIKTVYTSEGKATFISRV